MKCRCTYKHFGDESLYFVVFSNNVMRIVRFCYAPIKNCHIRQKIKPENCVVSNLHDSQFTSFMLEFDHQHIVH